MNILSQYFNLGTSTLTDQKKIDAVRLYNTLAVVGVIVNLLYFILLVVINNVNTGYINLFFMGWFAVIPVLNARHLHRTALYVCNLIFAPLALSLAIAYGGNHHVEHFLFVGLALTYFSFSGTKPLILLTTINVLAFIVIFCCIHFGLFPAKNSPGPFLSTFLLIADLIIVVTGFCVILYRINRHYRKYEETLRLNARELRTKSTLVEESLESAKKANATKLKLLKVISHDLRGPFTGLLGLTELMENQYEKYNKNEMKEMLRMLSDSSKNTLMLLENLVQWSKLHSEGIRMDRKNIRINAIIKQIIQIYSNMALQKQVTIYNETDEFLLINADENMMMLIVRNILNNALKYTPVGGEIRISAAPRRRYVRITIADTGMGMSPEQINAILADEENTSSAGTMGEKGSGLGLVLCKEFIEKHNCRLYIDSVQGEGTKVTFTVPVAKPEE